MTAAHTQIKTAFEVNGMSPEEISVDLGFDLGAVKSILLQCSSDYRKAFDKNGEGLDFSDEDLRIANRIILEAATSASDSDGNPDYRCRSQNAQYIRDDKKGRKELKKVMAGNTFNIFALNEQFKEAREAMSKNMGMVIEAPRALVRSSK